MTPRPKLLDLFCGAGLAADGYAQAGWEVVGIDIEPQPDYPYEFFQGDALWPIRTRNFDAIHASPPCQMFTRAGKLREAQGGESRYPDLLTPTLAMLRESGVPWVVENVEGAKALMPGAVRLCGSSFGLQAQRHRLFMSNVAIVGTDCEHWMFPADPVSGKPRPWGVYHVPSDNIPSGGRTARDAKHGRLVMGVERNVPWDALKEGFPPAYTRHIGRQLMAAVQGGTVGCGCWRCVGAADDGTIHGVPA